MDTDCPPAPSGAASAEPKRSWISPAVLELGGMRQLTLLQGGTGGGDCDPFENPACP